jgi:hypothetical protein
MTYSNYGSYRQKPKRKLNKKIIIVAFAIILFGGLWFGYKWLTPTPVEKSVNNLQFDTSVTESEKQQIQKQLVAQNKSYDGTLKVSAKAIIEPKNQKHILSAFVLVSSNENPKQNFELKNISSSTLYIDEQIDDVVVKDLASILKVNDNKLTKKSFSSQNIGNSEIFIISAEKLSPKMKLLRINNDYYLDAFNKGAIFRQATFEGVSADNMKELKLNELPNKESVLKINMTGVTAITRLMMRKLNTVNDAKYFSAKIGEFLADADITHVSNEVSFKEGCTINFTVFCSPKEAIDTLKDSGVDLVELTGNHNNDVGSQYNSETIKLYQGLGWSTFGGGINSAEAQKPYLADKKSSKVAFLGYNYPDSPDGGAIAGQDKAGANSFDFEKIKLDIESSKQNASFVIVDVQFWECYAYPEGYVEYPECDLPIPNQKDVFRKIADLGADMVIGTQAHQPQVYEIYNDKPIYYGLGNLYFDQTQWPGTERGIILSHYFYNGKLLQTKLSPTVYDESLQTRLMTPSESEAFLSRLIKAKSTQL